MVTSKCDGVRSWASDERGRMLLISERVECDAVVLNWVAAAGIERLDAPGYSGHAACRRQLAGVSSVICGSRIATEGISRVSRKITFLANSGSRSPQVGATSLPEPVVVGMAI